jgi:hypothetical protein
MAVEPRADELGEVVLQLRPGLMAVFDEGTVQEVEIVAIIKSFFAPMWRQLAGIYVRQGGQLHLTDCFVHCDAHGSRLPFPSATAEVASTVLKLFFLFRFI